ncbi:hypothetical protein U9M48_022904, partial [Paspalum notatum var. saurae]
PLFRRFSPPPPVIPLRPDSRFLSAPPPRTLTREVEFLRLGPFARRCPRRPRGNATAHSQIASAYHIVFLTSKFTSVGVLAQSFSASTLLAARRSQSHGLPQYVSNSFQSRCFGSGLLRAERHIAGDGGESNVITPRRFRALLLPSSLRCPRALDPRPSWTLGDVLAELDALDATRQAAPLTPLKQPPDWAGDGIPRDKAFVMRVDDEDDTDDEHDISDGVSQALVPKGARFSFNDLESSDSEDELCQVAPYHLMEKRNLEKSILLELERVHHLKVQEEVRSKLAALEVCHQNEIQRTISAFARLQKYSESRKEIDRRLDVHFQRRIAEVLDKHLSMVQRDHEQKSQIAERRIKDDAALEEAKRQEQAIKDKKLRQERVRQEAEARQKEAAKLAAEARKTAFEAAQKEAAEKEAADMEAAKLRDATASQSRQNSQNNVAGIKVFADKYALEAESRRRALVHNQVPESIHLSKIISIVKSRNTKDKTFGNLAFACGYVMLLVTNQVPEGMDYLLAEFNRVCIYTVPKHLHALNAQVRNRDYYRLIGYQEENGQLESTESYLTYVVAYVKLYAAMIQGWKWLAMFLNALPASTATAYALHAFLKMAGFALHKKYGSQFMKILDVISRCILPALKEQGNKMQSEAVNNLQNYLNDKIYLEEPEGQYLVQQLLSKELFM